MLKIWNYNQVHFHWSITGVIPKRARIIWKTVEVGGMFEPFPALKLFYTLGTENCSRHFTVGWLYPSHTHFQFAFPIFYFDNALKKLG